MSGDRLDSVVSIYSSEQVKHHSKIEIPKQRKYFEALNEIN